MKKLFYVIIIFGFLSCNKSKEYIYIETIEDISMISGIKSIEVSEPIRLTNAISDSMAFIHAFKKFARSCKVAKIMKESYGIRTNPISFGLFNHDGENIATTIYFIGKDSIENEIMKAELGRVYSPAPFDKELLDKINARYNEVIN